MKIKLLIIILFLFLVQSLQANIWNKEYKFESDRFSDWFGYSVSLSKDGNTVAFGIPFYIGNNNDTGQVRIYIRDEGNEWVQKGNYINAKKGETFWGSSVSLSADGNTIAIGSPKHHEVSNNAGQVRIYKWSGNKWVQKGKDFNGTGVRSEFGHSVSLSADGNTVIIGAPYYSKKLNAAGQVRIFTWENEQWIPKGNAIDCNEKYYGFGFSVDINDDGKTIAIGAPYLFENDQAPKGFTQIFTWIDNKWRPKGDSIEGMLNNEASGRSVSLSSDGNTIAIGSPYYNHLVGITRIYSWQENKWMPKGNFIEGKPGGKYVGYSVSLSSDGNSLAVGAPGNNEHNYYGGQTKVFTYKNNLWQQIGTSINGDSVENWSGFSVSLSGDGNNLVIGAPSPFSFHTKSYTSIYQYQLIENIKTISNNSTIISPNPATDYIEITFSDVILSEAKNPFLNVKVYDVLGAEVLQQGHVIPAKAGISSVRLDVSGLPAGVYFVRVGGRMYKFVKM